MARINNRIPENTFYDILTKSITVYQKLGYIVDPNEIS